MENIEQHKKGVKLIEEYLKSKDADNFQWSQTKNTQDKYLVHLSFQCNGQNKGIDLSKEEIEDYPGGAGTEITKKKLRDLLS